MNRLSFPLGRLKPSYDVVVVGSGYGGSVAAAHLSACTKGSDNNPISVCILERGRETHPGEYPMGVAQALSEFQLRTRRHRFGRASGMYDLRMDGDVAVVQGCGLGGTSLMNAGVVIRPSAEVLSDEAWPKEIREGGLEGLEQYYAEVLSELGAARYPREPSGTNGDPRRWVRLRKLEALEAVAADTRFGAAGRFERVEVAVNYAPFRTSEGVLRHECRLCGDCVSGCNYGAKNTLLMNYLPRARARGAEIFCEVQVLRVAPAHDAKRWLVELQLVDLPRERYRPPPMFVTADVVILAAGTLGSTEILLRSGSGGQSGLRLSGQLGRRFSANGDVIAFGYNSRHVIDGVGAGERIPRAATGPTITGMIDLRRTTDGEVPVLEEQLVVQEGAIPGVLRSLARIVLPVLAFLRGKHYGELWLMRVRRLLAMFVTPLSGEYSGALERTQTYLVMGHDSSDGEIRLTAQGARVRWPRVSRLPVYRAIEARLVEASKAIFATHVSPFLGSRPWTVHPLGGCVMGDGPASGVVDHFGRVFNADVDAAASEDKSVHEGLYVMDGSVVPRSLGANPLATIAALAKRSVERLAQDRQWNSQAEQRVPRAALPPLVRKLGLRFSERLRGHVAVQIEDSTTGASQGPKGEMTAVLTIESDDLDELTTSGDHAANLCGTVHWPAVDPNHCLTATGTFQLFARDRSRVETYKMRYQMRCHSRDGRRFVFVGWKTISASTGMLGGLRAVTALKVKICEEGGDLKYEGRLVVRFWDAIRLLMSVRATNAKGWHDRVFGPLKFMLYYLSTFRGQYGWVFRPADVADPYDLARQIWNLNEHGRQYTATTGDGVRIRLTRYHGGSKGPIIMAPGFGTSAVAFVISTNDVFENGSRQRRSFTDFLMKNGYDVWLLDYRASELSDAAGTQFTIDDIARYDFPAAVAEVLRVRKEEDGETRSVQFLGHCVGSAALMMSLLAGHLKGVRTAIFSQVFTHVDQPLINRIKARLRLAWIFRAVGGWPTFNPDFDVRAGASHRLLDMLLRLHPGEKCRNPVCRRIQFLYGVVNRHEQLNTRTHDAMHEMFNEANLTTFAHLSRIIALGRLVASDDSDVYVTPQGAARLKLPITLVQGENNWIFRPRGLQRSYEWLVEAMRAQGVLEDRPLIWDAHGPGLVSRLLIEGTEKTDDDEVDRYGHMDLFIGRDPRKDVFEPIRLELERGDRVAAYLHDEDTGLPGAAPPEAWKIPAQV